jgi:hypothetical protein
MWTPEQWEKQKALDAERRAKRRAVARRMAARADYLGRSLPVPQHASDCQQKVKHCTCGASVDLSRPGRAGDAPVQAQAAVLLAARRRRGEQNRARAEQNARRRSG